jgi:PPE-repeat protein
MSSVGFVPGAVKELETLREAWKTLNNLLKNLANAEADLQKHNLKLVAVHLKVAKWNAGQAKKAIAAVGQDKIQMRTAK